MSTCKRCGGHGNPYPTAMNVCWECNARAIRERDSLRAQLADRDAEILRLRTQVGLDSSQREDELRAQLAEAKADRDVAESRKSEAFRALRDRAEKAEAALAQAQAEAGEMREALRGCVEWHNYRYAPETYKAAHDGKAPLMPWRRAEAALASTSGRALLERVRRYEDALRPFAGTCLSCMKPTKHHPPGPPCPPTVFGLRIGDPVAAWLLQAQQKARAALREEDSE